MKTIKTLLILVPVLVISCSPARRLERMLDNHPELTFSDTVVQCDTLVVPMAKADTALSLVALTMLPEPAVISSGRLEMRILSKHDTIRIRGRCKPDTIHHILRIPVERIRWIKPDRTDALIAKIPWIAVLLVALLGVFLLLFRVRNKFSGPLP